MEHFSHITGITVGEHCGLPALLIETPASKAAVSLFGAHVLSFTPTGQADLLWMSPTTKAPPQPIRGGIPLCWPYFAKQGQPETAQQHGVARTTPWRVLDAQQFANGDVELTFVPTDAPIAGLNVKTTLRVGASLTQTLTTENQSSATHALTQAFHTYFRVGDARQVRVRGLDQLSYLDKFAHFAAFTQQGEFAFEDRSDRIYQKTSGAYTLVDPVMNRNIEISSVGSATLVVWNAGAEAIKTFTDIPHDAWPDYFCLEVANAGAEVVMLSPGGKATMGQTISVV